MSIRPHPTKGYGWWQIWISQGRGKKPRVLIFEGSEIEAKAYEHEIRGTGSRGAAKIIDVIGPFLTWYETNRMASTVKACKLAWQSRLLQHYGLKYLSLLTSTDHEQYKQRRLQDGVSMRTINIELLYLRSLLTFARNEGYDTGQGPKLFEKRYTKAKTPNVLTPDELEALASQLNGYARIMVLLMGKCGLRKGEVSKLEPADIRENLLRVIGKGGKQRIVPMPPDVQAELAQYAEGKTGILFPVKDIRKRILTAAAKAGIGKHLHPHLFRHTAGTIAVKAGVQQRVIQDWLGHSDIRTTEIYTRVVAENLQQAVNQMSQMYQTKTPNKANEPEWLER